MEFWYGVVATVALYLFCRWIAFIAPPGDGKERESVKRIGSNPPPTAPKPPPPPNPPTRHNGALSGRGTKETK